MNLSAYDIAVSYEENYRNGPRLQETLPPVAFKGRRVPFLGYEVNSLLGIPAGPLLNSKWIIAYARLGFDLLVYKTVRTTARPSHPPPNCMFLEMDQQIKTPDSNVRLIATLTPPGRLEDISITNSFGMPSRDPSQWQADIGVAKRGLAVGQILIVSVVGTPGVGDLADDYARGAAMAVEAGADMVEINLSCPNVVTKEGSIYNDPDASSTISKCVKESIGAVPLIIKIGFVANTDALAKVAAANAKHVQAISSINTLSFEVVRRDGTQALPGPGRLRSGVCGAAIRPCALKQTAQLAELKRLNKYDFSVIGVGGILTPDHIQEYFNVGAEAVMSATGAMWNPHLARQWAGG